MRISYLFCAIFLFCLGQVHGEKAKVSIGDYWGTLTVQAGRDPLKLTCSATNANPNGKFIWTVDETPLPEQDEEKIKVLENEFQQNYFFQPEVNMDGKALKCKYTEFDENGGILSEGEDSVALKVTYLKLPEGKVDAGEYEMGEDAELSVLFEVYPDPDPSLIKWVVTDENGAKQEINSGDASMFYSASNLESVEDYKYRSTLTITKVAEEDIKNTYALVMQLDDTESEIPVVFTIKQVALDDTTKAAEIREQKPTESAIEEITTMENPEKENTMGVGLFVIIAIIILILLVCAGYCIYQNCCSKDSRRSQTPSAPTTGMQYSRAPTEEKNPA